MIRSDVQLVKSLLVNKLIPFIFLVRDGFLASFNFPSLQYTVLIMTKSKTPESTKRYIPEMEYLPAGGLLINFQLFHKFNYEWNVTEKAFSLIILIRGPPTLAKKD